MNTAEPADLYTASMMDADVAKKRELAREARMERNRAATLFLRRRLKAGDRIRATRGQCCAGPETYTFLKWDGGWIVSASLIDDIIPASVTKINRVPVDPCAAAPDAGARA